jgi:hypothetical protein
MPFIHDIFRILFLNLFHGFRSTQKGASRTLEHLGLPSMKEWVGILERTLERKCIDMRGVNG